MHLKNFLINIKMSIKNCIISCKNFFFSRILQLEEEYIQKVCSDVIALKPDVVFTEKGVSGEMQTPL